MSSHHAFEITQSYFCQRYGKASLPLRGLVDQYLTVEKSFPREANCEDTSTGLMTDNPGGLRCLSEEVLSSAPQSETTNTVSQHRKCWRHFDWQDDECPWIKLTPSGRLGTQLNSPLSRSRSSIGDLEIRGSASICLWHCDWLSRKRRKSGIVPETNSSTLISPMGTGWITARVHPFMPRAGLGADSDTTNVYCLIILLSNPLYFHYF